MSEYLTIILSIATLIIGGGGLLYYKQNKLAKELENEAKQSEEWRKLYEEMKAEAKERDAKIDDLYTQIKAHRDEKAELRTTIADLQVKVTSLKYTKCEKLYCAERVPPTELTPSNEKLF